MEIKQENIINFFNTNVAFKAQLFDPSKLHSLNKGEQWNCVPLLHMLEKDLLLKADSSLKTGDRVCFKIMQHTNLTFMNVQTNYHYIVCTFDDLSNVMKLEKTVLLRDED